MSHGDSSTASKGPVSGEVLQRIHSGHISVLDGWRGVSILLVMSGHLLPVGPREWRANEMLADMGMAIFFTLSGFLITRFLLDHDSVRDFLIRRFFRIVPLAWLGSLAALLMAHAPMEAWLPHFAFYANLPPITLTSQGAHLWSLCVEVQFYVGIALVVAVLGRRGLYLLPVLCVAVTVNRAIHGIYVDIVTIGRVDEILAGCILALATNSNHDSALMRFLRWLNPYPLLAMLAIASHPQGDFMNFFRPYLASLLVGSTLIGAPAHLEKWLCNRVLRYIATISYALYVTHMLLAATWLGSGERVAKYLKRPLLVVATLALSHFSTFHFERHWQAAGKRLSQRLSRTTPRTLET